MERDKTFRKRTSEPTYTLNLPKTANFLNTQPIKVQLNFIKKVTDSPSLTIFLAIIDTDTIV